MLRWLTLLVVLLGGSCTTQEGLLEPHSSGTVEIEESSELKAWVFLEGVLMDSLNERGLIIDSISSGPHQLTLFAPGYAMLTRDFVIEPNSLTELQFSLKKAAFGSLQVFSKEGAKVIVAGVQFGVINKSGVFELQGLAVGDYQVSVNFGSESTETLLRINEHETTTLSAELSLKKQVLIEHISNVNCLPCPSHARALYEVLDSLNWEGISKISYNANWPLKEDPFYLFDVEVQKEKALFYGREVNYAIPIFTVNGKVLKFEANNSNLKALLREHIKKELSELPQIKINLLDSAIRLQSLSEVKIEATLSVHVTQDKTHFENVPGTNGETEFLNAHKRRVLYKSIVLEPREFLSEPLELSEVLEGLPKYGLTLNAFVQTSEGVILQSLAKNIP
jgi:hypothetical protein